MGTDIHAGKVQRRKMLMEGRRPVPPRHFIKAPPPAHFLAEWGLMDVRDFHANGANDV